MSNLTRYIPIALIAGFFLYSYLTGSSSYDEKIDLNQVLDVTVETIYELEEANPAQEETTAGQEGSNQSSDDGFLVFSEKLEENYNSAQPAIYAEKITVMPREDASLIAFVDKDGDDNLTDADEALYMIEVDGENSRIIATSGSGAVNDHRFSGSGLLTGYIIGSMLSRQRAAGVNPKSLSNKKTQTAKQAAKSRAGSGSHSRGK